MLDCLFRQKWESFDYTKIDRYPGVYVVAWSDEQLVNTQVSEDTVSWVGMSLSKDGVNRRLNQFDNTINIKGVNQHSGANRILSKEFSGSTYRQYIEIENNSKRLYMAVVQVKCQVVKKERKAIDLQIMGSVAKLEFEVLARIKNETGYEPIFNKK